MKQLKAENEALRAAVEKLIKDAPNDPIKRAKPEPDAAGVAAAPAVSADTIDPAAIDWPEPFSTFWERPPRTLPPPTTTASVPQDNDRMHVVHITAELAPLAKVGGLGDVVTGLARAVGERGHTVEVVLPFYECIDVDQVENLRHERDFDVPKGFEFDGKVAFQSVRTSVHRGTIAGCEVVLLRPETDNARHIFRGGEIYGGGYNQLEAYLYFCRAALEFLKTGGAQPHVLHLHEWQTSAAAMLYWDVYNSEGSLNQARVVLTIHNMDNPGECRVEEFAAAGVDGEQYMDVKKAMDERTIGHNPERMSLLKGGIIYSNDVTTVSPTYAQETLEGGAAGWMGQLLTANKQKYHGILNGIDTMLWDPERDPYLPLSFGPASSAKGKLLMKEYVQKGLGLDVNPDKPLVICVTRLVPQKGLHLIRHAIGSTAERGGQFVLLGSGHGDGDFRALAEGEFKDHPNVRLKIMYNEALSHLIFAASDITLVPSMFEPCGLTQMVAMRYGSLPLVRRTGGLADTVVDVDADPENGNGYVFDGGSEAELDLTLSRALEAYRTRRAWWSGMQQKIMGTDWSWARSAEQYAALYRGP